MLVPPLAKLLSRLTESWGAPGVAGDPNEIHHVCRLIRDALEQIAAYEEGLYFIEIDDDFRPIVKIFKDCLGSQARKLENIPDVLDNFVALIGTDHGGTVENPHVVQEVITFELPPDWEESFSRELKRIGSQGEEIHNTGCSLSGLLIAGILFAILWIFLF